MIACFCVRNCPIVLGRSMLLYSVNKVSQGSAEELEFRSVMICKSGNVAFSMD